MTEPVHGYITVDQLKAVLRATKDTFDDSYALAIESASRQIDEHCNDQFWVEDTPVARVFRVENPRQLWVGSFASTTDMVVELDLDDDGTFEVTLDASDWQPSPVDRRPGWPYDRIEALGSTFFPGSRRSPYFGYGNGYSPGYYGPSFGGEWFPGSQRARVRVTALWGWPSVPAQVRQACQILAIDQFKSKDLTNGSAGTPGLATKPLGASHSPGSFNPMAKSLLCGLRDVVIA